MSDTSTVPDKSVLVQGPNPDHQVVQIVNRTNEPWSDKWGGVTFTCPAMSPAGVPGRIFVPFYAMCYWFGHPDAFDHPTDRNKRYRLEEYERLQVYYGVYDDGLEAFLARTPNVELFTDMGDPIITVKDDPAGKHLTPAVQSEQQQELIQQTLAKLTAEVARLQGVVQQQEAEREALATGGHVGSDAPAPHGESPGPILAGIAPDAVPIPGGPGVPGDVPTAPPSVQPPDGGVTEDSPIVPKTAG